ncbi:IS66 family insertion sequence element accessory protein TnpB [Phaeovulum sp.]|uniref:IS66 family insertion sequence element accessory protein TnpB n=1 Tax=Phaeovulum sp. TaxID=2934796 RepID=UPI0039E4EF16
MIGPGTGVRVYLACGVTDMRKGIEGLAALAQDHLRQKPTGGAVFAFHGRRGESCKAHKWFAGRLSEDNSHTWSLEVNLPLVGARWRNCKTSRNPYSA